MMQLHLQCSSVISWTSPVSGLGAVLEMSSTNGKMEVERAPKKKEEFVARLKQMTCIPLVTLQEMSLEKLRVVYQSAKPVMFRPLPANWKRFKKSELQVLYQEKVMPWLGMEVGRNVEYLQWNRDKLVVELQEYADEVGREEVVEPPKPTDPAVCPSCQVKMVRRVNRLTHHPFWGCVAFPSCKQTFAMEYFNMPTAEAQKKHGKDGSTTSKVNWTDGGEEMDGETLKRAMSVPVPTTSEASWEPVQEEPMNLSAQEKKLIEQMRRDNVK